MTSLRKLVSLAFMVLLLATLGFAQGSATGDLRVTVKDQKGNLVTNATVTARAQAKGLERSVSQNATGEYRLVALPPGVYTVMVTGPGFAKLEAPDQIVTVGQMKDLPMVLSVAGAQEVVTVSSEAELVETTRSSTTNTIEQRRIDNLPTNGRNYINFTLTDSQVLRDNAPNIGAAPTSGLNFGGQRARANLVNVDGADAVDNSTNGIRATVSQEAVQEFQIQTNGYAAEYGRASGGVVNIVTRSGSNDFHGSVYGYLRNRNFQAVNPFSTTSNPAYTRVQAGAAFGGAIKKDKTFYYFSYEITRRHETGFASIGAPGGNFGLVPFDATNIFAPGLAPPGTFTIQVTPTQAAFLSNPPPLPPGVLQQYAFVVGGSSAIALRGSYPAAFGLLVGAPGGLPIPANGSDPLAQFPSSCNPLNTTCNGLPGSFLTLDSQKGNFPVFEGTSLYSLRLDHNISNDNHIMLRGNVSPSTVTGIEVNGQNQTFGQNAYSRTSQQTYRDFAIVGQDTWTIGNNKVNELRFQYARRGLSYFYSNAPGGGDISVNIPGFAFFGREPYSYIRRTEERYQFSDNFSFTAGRHGIKFGGDFNYIPLSAIFTVNYSGVYGFGAVAPIPGLPELSPVQTYGFGTPSTLVQGIGNPNDSFTNKPLGFYLQDAWRVRPNLTLNLGVRYDVEFPPNLAAPTGLALSAYNQLGLQKGIQTDTNNVQPRVGIAWDPKGDGKSVFRASYGIFYDHPLLGLYFLGDASDGSKSGQLLFAGAAPCDGSAVGSPGNLNATNIFQGILGTAGCLPGIEAITGYQQTSADGTPNPQRFDPFFPNSVFNNQNYLNPATFFPLAFQPFGYPQSKNFVYAYSQQINFAFEHDLGNGLSISLAYNFNGGRHINRPINANTTRGDFLLNNWRAAFTDPSSNASAGPLQVGAVIDATHFPCNPTPPSGTPWVSAALMNFFRPSGLNPAIALALLSNPLTAPCVGLAQNILHTLPGFNAACDPTSPTLDHCVPFSDMDANYSNGSSVYHGLTANLRKRFGGHYEFLASYTWSHAIDDSTDLQSPLSPQNSYFPSLERSNSLFDQRHRLVFSGVYQTGHVSGEGWWNKFASNWTFAPIIEVSSGRPFNIITGNPDNFQFSPYNGRPLVVPANTPTSACQTPTVASRFSPSGFLQEPCFIDALSLPGPVTLQSTVLDGNLGRNAGLKPWTVFNDLRVSLRFNLGERVSLDASADIFNIANRFNVADVNQLWTGAGQATSSYDPRQFQFGLKVSW